MFRELPPEESILIKLCRKLKHNQKTKVILFQLHVSDRNPGSSHKHFITWHPSRKPTLAASQIDTPEAKCAVYENERTFVCTFIKAVSLSAAPPVSQSKFWQRLLLLLPSICSRYVVRRQTKWNLTPAPLNVALRGQNRKWIFHYPFWRRRRPRHWQARPTWRIAVRKLGTTHAAHETEPRGESHRKRVDLGRLIRLWVTQKDEEGRKNGSRTEAVGWPVKLWSRLAIWSKFEEVLPSIVIQLTLTALDLAIPPPVLIGLNCNHTLYQTPNDWH